MLANEASHPCIRKSIDVGSGLGGNSLPPFPKQNRWEGGFEGVSFQRLQAQVLDLLTASAFCKSIVDTFNSSTPTRGRGGQRMR